MPIPIKPIPDYSSGDHSGNYSFLANYDMPLIPSQKKIIVASDKDAKLLFDIWCKSEKSQDDTFKVDSSLIGNNDILRLKTKGFISGGVDEIRFTKKGKTVISTIALSEPNNFAKNRQQKPYNEILANMDKRNKPGYRMPKYASNTSNNMDLRKIFKNN